MLYIFMLGREEKDRSATHNSPGQSPAMVIFGKEMRLPSELRFGTPPSDARLETSDYVAELQEYLRNIHDKTRDKLKLSSDRTKTRYDSLLFMGSNPPTRGRLMC
uniref:Uncharacterized protein n=1 Tax=Cacopsylla melanoneura TaxID=428564 RepID=A0A8D8PR76_9HEMI